MTRTDDEWDAAKLHLALEGQLGKKRAAVTVDPRGLATVWRRIGPNHYRTDTYHPGAHVGMTTAARIIGCSRRTVHYMAADGRLKVSGRPPRVELSEALRLRELRKGSG